MRRLGPILASLLVAAPAASADRPSPAEAARVLASAESTVLARVEAAYARRGLLERLAPPGFQPRARLFELASRDLQIGHARNLESIETLRVLEHCGVAARANVVADRRDRALYFPVQCRVECNELRKQLAETGLYGRQTCDLRHASPRLS